MVADRIRELRIKNGLTQLQLAKMLHITRSSVNAWEMGISVPSTALIIELAKNLKTNTDYLLGVDLDPTISVKGLSGEEIAILVLLANKFRSYRERLPEDELDREI